MKRLYVTLLCYERGAGYNEATWRSFVISEVLHNSMSNISPLIVTQYCFRVGNGEL